VEQELLTLSEQMSSPPVFSEIYALVFCAVFCRSLFVLFPLSFVLSVFPFTASDYPVGIIKLFLSTD
jgi:hypothetical protein